MDSVQAFSNSVASHTNRTNDLGFKENIEVNFSNKEKPTRNPQNNLLTMKHNEEEEHASIFHGGVLFIKIDEENKKFKKKACKISDGQFISINTKNQMEKSISVTSISSIQTVDEPKKYAKKDLFCFKVKFKSCPKYYLFGAVCSTERLVWMQKLLGSVSDKFPFKIISEFKKSGYASLKESVNDEWKQDWLLLHNRVLKFGKQICGLESIDLRKVRTVVIQKNKEFKTSVLIVDCIITSIYLKFDAESEILNWHHLIKAETVNISSHLKDQQLTMDQVPVIVEKCIRFLFVYGYFSEGIYRLNGSFLKVSRLLSAFHRDAWAVQLSFPEYSVNDVASVLKRFFKNLSESLFTIELHLHFCNAAKCNSSENKKVIYYRSLLERLPIINYVTVRKLLNHLYYIQLQSDKNLMSATNLAAVWGPTLMHIEISSLSSCLSNIESAVVSDLILLYPKLFDVGDDEKKREIQFSEVMKNFNLSNSNALQLFKRSGNILLWIYLGSKYKENCVSVNLSPSKTASMICDELAGKMGASYGYSLGLQEVICNGTMFRPIHHSEFLLDIVLLWGYWDEKYRKDNYIVCLFPNSLLSKIMPFTKGTLTICGELKFADIKSKSYKWHLFEISEGKLICYKDKSGSAILYEWCIKDILWYIGFESNRNPHTRWCITFTSKNNNHPKEPKDYFGWSIAGTTSEDHLRWMAALLSSEYGVDNIAPPVSINLLDY